MSKHQKTHVAIDVSDCAQITLGRASAALSEVAGAYTQKSDDSLSAQGWKGGRQV